MAFSITQVAAKAGDKAGEIFRLGDDQARIEVWPFIGFNCLRWQVRGSAGWRDLLYVSPEWDTNPVPTRSGHPILFPFPNRLCDGRLSFAGSNYQGPLTDKTGLHAIHGFTPRDAWGHIEAGIADDHAWIVGEFLLSRDLQSARRCWPADARLRVGYRLFHDRFRVEATVDTADGKPMPFGLGYHPYFMLGGSCDDWRLCTPAQTLWEVKANFPTGRKLALPEELNFQKPRPLGSIALDTAYSDLEPGLPMASVRSESGGFEVIAERAFRELLLFTPAHRQALAIEPYTCTANAAHLQSEEVDSGWRTLAAGETFASAVEYRFSSAT